MKRRLWDAVHRYLPCSLIHLLCSSCREEGLCGKCIESKTAEWGGYAMPPAERERMERESGVPVGLYVNGTFSTAQTVTLTFPPDGIRRSS